MHDMNLYQGDILLTSEQQAALEATSNPSDPHSTQRAVTSVSRARWRDAVVPYELEGSLSKYNLVVANGAARAYRIMRPLGELYCTI